MDKVIGWIITDSHNNPLLFEPTYFDWVDDTEIIIPLVLDSGKYTLFKNDSTLNETMEGWESFIQEMNYRIKPLIGNINPDCVVMDFKA